MTKPRCRTGDPRLRAATLVELIISLSALAIIVLGHSIVSYHARLDSVKSVKQSTAAMVALLLCESWAGVDGAATYDPVADLASEFTVSAGSGPSAPVGFTSVASCSVAIDGTCYHATLSSQALASTLLALNAAVAWCDRGGDPATLDREFRLTTYVLLD